MSWTLKMQIACGAALLAVGAAVWLTETVWSASLGFAAGLAVSAFYPDALAFVVAHVKNAFTWIRARVKDVLPARPLNKVRSVAANIPIRAPAAPTSSRRGNDALASLSNLAQFFGAVFWWCLRHPVMAIGLALIAFWLIFGRACSPFENFTKSRDLVEFEQRLAERQAALDRRIAAESEEIVNQFNRATVRIDTDLARASEEVESASHEDTLVMLRAWRDGARRLRQHSSDGDTGA